jgi:Mce-associated membrane protein
MAAQTARVTAWWRANASSPIALGLVAVLLATFGIWALRQADAVRDDPSARNTALTDAAATSEVKGAVADMIGKVFSYNYTDPSRTSEAVRGSLTGDAVRQHETIFAKVRQDAPKAKTVLSTRVTDSAVTTLTDGHAVVLVFADQQTTRTSDGESTTTPAMLTVTAVHRQGHWKISALNTFTAP